MLSASPTSAQVVRGIVVDAETRDPLQAALVVLVDSTGRDLQRFLVDATGTFFVEARAPGSYSLRVERLGANTNTLADLELTQEDTLTLRVPLSIRAIALDGIEVESDQRCELSGDGTGQTQQVWEEARKVLSVASVTDASTWYRYDLVRYRRELDPDDLTVQGETLSRQTSSNRRPIESRSIDLLVDSGYVVHSSGGDRYYAPDADVLLSSPFLDTHCFSLRAGIGEEEGLLGLGFRPLDAALSNLADIEGTLWIEPETGGLEWIEFQYTSLPGAADDLRSEKVGGRIEFHGLPDGRWIVSNWYIRMPVGYEVFEPMLDRITVRLERVVEEGGRITRARERGTGQVAFAERTGSIEGTVEVSEGGGAGQGASIVVLGVGSTSPVDERGRFTIDGLPAGDYQLALARPEMMGLDRGYPVADVRVATEVVSEITVTPRPYGEVLRWVCGFPDWPVGSGVLIGEVVDPITGTSVANAEISATWQAFRTVDLDHGYVDGSEQSIGTATNEVGSFRVCGVPVDQTLTVAAYLQDGSRAERALRIEAEQPVVSLMIDSDFHIAEQTLVDALVGAYRPGDIRTSIRVMGSVEARESGDALAGALVRLDGSEPVLTDDDGRFVLNEVPYGRHTIEVEYLGRAPLVDTLNVDGMELAGVTLRVDEAPIPIEGLEVVVEARSLGLEAAGFYERRDFSGLSGTRITREHIEERPGARMTDLLRVAPGARMFPPGHLAGAEVMRLNRRGNEFYALQERRGLPGCEPTIYVDDIVYIDDIGAPPGSLRVTDMNFLSADVIEGIEVYSGLAAPARYDPRDCGVVLIWTRGYR
jgi:hypothetical protein